LSKRTLDLFENKQQRQQKDFAGLNVLLAFTLNNLTRTEEEGEEIEQLVKKDAQPSLINSLLKMDFNDTYKATFGTFYPSKFQISSVLLGCLFLNSPSKMRELLSMEAKDSHLKNSEIYSSLRSGLPNLREEDLKFWLGQL